MSADGNARQYPRTTSTSFLERCSARVASFYGYWDSKRNGGTLPSLADLDTAEMWQWLAGIVVVDVQRNPTRLTYSLVGPRSVELKGFDATGRSVVEAFHGSGLVDVLENYRLVIEEKKPVYDWDSTASRSGLSREAETLLLPLSSDGMVVDRVIVYLELGFC